MKRGLSQREVVCTRGHTACSAEATRCVSHVVCALAATRPGAGGRARWHCRPARAAQVQRSCVGWEASPSRAVSPRLVTARLLCTHAWGPGGCPAAPQLSASLALPGGGATVRGGRAVHRGSGSGGGGDDAQERGGAEPVMQGWAVGVSVTVCGTCAPPFRPGPPSLPSHTFSRWRVRACSLLFSPVPCRHLPRRCRRLAAGDCQSHWRGMHNVIGEGWEWPLVA